jgi:mannose-6-phosphate isomerase-like protein (cupin superfamily)
MKFSVDEYLSRLPLPPTEKWPEGVRDVEPFEKDGVKLVFFAPRGVDHQSSHTEDEFYFIVRGTATLVIDQQPHSATVSDVFFVPANVIHHFEDISDDFATWAIFF